VPFKAVQVTEYRSLDRHNNLYSLHSNSTLFLPMLHQTDLGHYTRWFKYDWDCLHL